MASDPEDSPLDADGRLALLDRLRYGEFRAVSAGVASVIGHLIGTPLNVIAGRAALLRTSSSVESVEENARRIEEQVEKLAERIRRLIAYLTVSDRQPQLSPVTCVLEDALSIYSRIAGLRKIKIERSASEVPDLQVDASSTLIVLTSLLSLSLRVAPEDSELRISVSQSENRRVVFALSVPGLTPPSSRIDKLDPPDSYQAKDAEQLQVLSSCFAIARRVGGQLEMTDEGGGRSTLRLTCMAA